MIDIHSHLLPGVDDGPKDWPQSLDLCRAMADNGIRRAIATPHLIDGVYNNVRSRVEPLAKELSERVQDAGIELEVLPGAEVDIACRHVTHVSEELPLLGGANAVLLEMPVAVVPHAMAEIIFAARSRGIIPVLAHPERNELVQDRPDMVTDWIDAGAALQLDGDSLLGDWGRRTKRCAEVLLCKGRFHAMASDAHSCDRRPPKLREALERACALVGDPALDLVSSAPAQILAGNCPATPMFDEVDAPRSTRQRSDGGRGLFGRLFGRPAG